MSLTLLVMLGLLGIAVGLIVNWAIWFILLPTLFRQVRGQYRRLRSGGNSN